MSESKFKKRNYRKKTNDIEEKDDDNEAKSIAAVTTEETEKSGDVGLTEEERELNRLPLAERLLYMKKIQQMRQKPKGMNGEKLLVIPAEISQSNPEVKEGIIRPKRPTDDDDDDDVQTRNLNLVETFQSKKAESRIDKIMEDFIEKEMMKRKGMTVEEEKLELFVTEDEKANKMLNKAAELKDSLLTGIPEVQLPIEYKMKNIEATEKAKKTLSEQEKFMAALSNTDDSVSDRYLFQGVERGSKRSSQMTATDDLALERFKKRMAHKW